MDEEIVQEKLDLTEIVRLNIKCVHFFGYFFPVFTENNAKKTMYFTYVVLSVGFTFVLASLSQIVYMLASFGDMEKMTEASFLLFNNIAQSFKIRCFIRFAPRIWRLIHKMNKKIFLPRSRRQCAIFTNEVEMSRTITKLFLLACTIACMAWGVSPIFDKRSGENIRLPLSGWYPFRSDKSPAFEFVYFYQLFSTWVSGLGNISMDTFMSGTIMFISAQLSILSNALESLKQENDDDLKSSQMQQKSLNKSLVRCVIHYKNITDFADETMNLFSIVITSQFLLGVIIICVSMFQMSLVSVLSIRSLAMMIYQVCIFTEMYLVCFYGNEVFLKSEKLTESAYMCEWIDAAAEFKQNLIIFMSRTQIPLGLYASGYFILSLETFKAIVKSSWSYFALLKQVHEET